MNKGLLVVISGPSGAGKGTVVNKLVSNDDYYLSISATTRKPREGETDGVSYFFKSREEFVSLIEDNKLLEYAQFCDNYYGTPLENVQSKLDEGKNVILEIEVQGALQVKKNMPEAVLIFMLPPSLDELRRRLVNRGTEAANVIEKRLSRAEEEVEFIKDYNYIVINDEVENAVDKINSIVIAEKSKVQHNSETINNFKGVK